MQKELKEYIKKENEIIKEMLSLGFENPWDNEGHASCLESLAPDGYTMRRFITALDFDDPKVARASQVKDEETRDKWINETLKPAIKAHGGVKIVPFKDPSGKIANGHGRRRSVAEIVDEEPESLWRLKEQNTKAGFDGELRMPWATITDIITIKDGKIIKNAWSARSEDALGFVSKIRANPPRDNDDYGRASVITQIDRIYEKDPTCMGFNPTGKPLYNDKDPKNEDNIKCFNALMDFVYEKQSWTDASQRGIIRAQLNKDRSVCKDINFSDVTDAAAILGWPTGVKPKTPNSKTNKPQRQEMGDWVDTNGVLYTFISTIGVHEKGKVRSCLVDKYFDGTLNSVPSVRLIMKVGGSPLTTKEALNKKRKEYLRSTIAPLNQDFMKNNELMKRIKSELKEDSEFQDKFSTWPLIEEVFFVEQLLPKSGAAQDSGLHATWNKQKQRFVIKGTKEIL